MGLIKQQRIKKINAGVSRTARAVLLKIGKENLLVSRTFFYLYTSGCIFSFVRSGSNSQILLFHVCVCVNNLFVLYFWLRYRLFCFVSLYFKFAIFVFSKIFDFCSKV